MKIICGTDFSEHAVQASRAAAFVSLRLGDEVVLAHIWDEALSEGLWNDSHDRITAAVRNRLYDHAIRLRETTGARVAEETFSGIPDVELVRMASRSEVRLLVVGPLGRRPGEWLFGSVAERAPMRAPVSTLVVRSAAPFEAWARGKAPLKIFVAFDFSGTAESELRWVKDLTAAGPCEIVVSYVDWPMGEAARLGVSGEFLKGQNPPQVQRILERELSERVGALWGETVARIRVEPSIGRADVRLVEMAREEQADLVVTGTHQRHGLDARGSQQTQPRAESRRRVAVIEESDIAKAIRQEAERFGAHLVCIGSHGRSGLAKAVLGSVAQSLMAQSPRPVLVIRKPLS